jgi:hypothetical protein
MSRSIDGEIDESQSFLAGWKDGRGHQDPRNNAQAIEARLDKLTNMIERLSKANGSLSVDEMGRQLRMMNQDIDTRTIAKSAAFAARGRTPKNAPGSSATSPRRTADSSGDEFPIPAGNATDLVDPIGSLNLGHLSLEDGGKSR